MNVTAYLEITMKINEETYLESEMFKNDVFVGLNPLWNAEPDVKIYTIA